MQNVVRPNAGQCGLQWIDIATVVRADSWHALCLVEMQTFVQVALGCVMSLLLKSLIGTWTSLPICVVLACKYVAFARSVSLITLLCISVKVVI